MSTTVDERIVSMQFDNKNFEKNVGESLSTLDKLKQKLNFSGVSKGLDEVNKASKQVDMSVLSNGVETVRTKFSALQIMATTALANITNSAVNAGKRIAMSLTIDPIKTGLSEYETQLNAIQTILANTESKGSTLEDVNSALDELNAYADKTIYNFTEMTRNIGTFTAAGVDLDTSVSAIKGIANLAAVSGSTSQQASTAMYQLSQALASGTVKLMDWNSVVNAGMGGQVFQDALKETARVHGVAIDEIIKNNGSFRESLKDGWLTSEILTETLSKFTGDLNAEQLKSMGYTEKQVEEIIKLGQTANDAATKVKTFTQLLDTLKESAQSGWAQTWEIIIGDFGEAKEMWTKVSDVIGGVISDSAEARNALLKGSLTSGWKQLLGEGIMDEKGYTHYIKEIAKEHGVAIDDMIKEEGSFEKALKRGLSEGSITSDMLSGALGKLSKDYSGFSDEQLKNLGYTKEQVEALAKLNEEVQNGSISMEEFSKKIQSLSGRELIMESFANIWKSIVSIIKPIKEAFRDIFPPTTADQLYKAIEGFRDFTAKLILSKEQSAKLRETFKGLFAAIDIGFTIIKSVVKTSFELVKTIFGLSGTILDATSSFSELILKLRDTIKESNVLTKIGEIIVNVTSNIVNSVKKLFKLLSKGSDFPLFASLGKILGFVWDLTGKLFAKIAEITKSGDIFGFINNLLSSGLLVGLIGLVNKLKDMFGGFGDVASGFGDILSSITGPLQGLQEKLKSEALKNIAVAIAILAGSLFVLSLVDPERLDNALAALTVAFTELIAAMAIMKKIDVNGAKGITKMIGLASALLILSGALAILSTISWGGIARALVAMNGALATMLGTLFILSKIDKSGMATKGSAQMRKMAVALVILGGALKILATMSWGDIGRSLTAMTGALAVMTGTIFVLSLISKKGNMATKGAKQMRKMAVSLVIVGGALKIFATMGWEDIGKALTAMTGALLIMTGVLTLMSLVSSKGGSTASLLVLSTTLVILGGALKILASMGWEDIGRALTAMSGALLVLVASLLIMSKLSGSGLSLIASAASLVVMAGAIALLVPSIAMLGNMKTSTIVKGLIALAAAFAVMGVAGLLLKSVVPTLLAFGAAAALIGVAVLGIGTGIGILAAGLATLVAAIVAGGAALVSTLLSLAEGVANLIPLIVQKLGEALISFCEVLRDGAPIIGEAIVAVLLSVLDVLVTVIPQLTDKLLQIIIGVLDALSQHVPTIVGYIFKILIGIINSIADYIPDLIQATINVFMSFFEGVIAALKNIDTNVLMEGIVGVGLIAALIAAISAITPLIPGAMVGIAGMGVVIAELAVVLAAIGALAQIPGLNSIISDGGKLLQTIGTAIGQFIGGILGGIAQGFTSSLPQIGTDLSNFMTNLQPFLNGINGLNANSLENAKRLAGVILAITAADIIQGLTRFITGGNSMSKFGSEIAAFGKGVKEFANQTSGIDPTTVTAAAEAGKNLGIMAKNIPTSGGLWDLIAGKNDLKGFADQLTYFGKGVKNFANEVSGINGETVKSAAEAGVQLGKMAKDVPTSGGLWDKIAGKNDLSEFGGQLKSFGQGVKNFAKEVAGISFESVTAGTKAGIEIANMAKKVPTSGGLWDKLSGKNDLANFATQLKSFGSAIKNFISEVNGVGDASKATSVVNTLNSSLKSFSTKGVEGMTETLTSAKTKVVQLINNILESSITAVTSKISKFADAGEKFITKFVETIKAGSSKVKSAFGDIISKAIGGIKTETNYNKFYSCGKYLVDGFASGISDNTYKAEAKATAMANAAASAAKAALKINSPSKIFYAIGAGTVEGLVNAEEDGINTVYKAGTKIGNTLVDGMKYAAATVKDIIENGVDQPVITPLLDLSGVTSGANAINGMFNTTPSVGVLSRLSNISTSVSQNQNRGNDEVITAIKDLNKTMKASSNDKLSIGNINVNGGTDLEEAINTIIRYAKIERRM